MQDTDDDGLSDYEEYSIYNTSPLNMDTDGDGATDKEEIIRYASSNLDNAPKVAELFAFLAKNYPDILEALGKTDDIAEVARGLSKTDELKLTRAQREILVESFEKYGLSHYLLKTSNGLKVKPQIIELNDDVWAFTMMKQLVQ